MYPKEALAGLDQQDPRDPNPQAALVGVPELSSLHSLAPQKSGQMTP